MEYRKLLIEIKDSVAVVTINKPDKLNTLDRQVLEELKNIFLELKNKEEVKAVIITGSGEKAFAAGADITELNKLDMISGKTFAENGQAVFDLIENFSKPVIAALNGFALGGGSELALACHIRLASENAKIGQPEVNLGIIPGFGGTQRLTRLINSGRALEYILTGNSITADEAWQLGIINHVYPREELMSKAMELARFIASKPQYAVKSAIKAVKIADQTGLKEGENFEAALFAVCCGTEDFKEGTSAFLEKRKPAFRDK